MQREYWDYHRMTFVRQFVPNKGIKSHASVPPPLWQNFLVRASVKCEVEKVITSLYCFAKGSPFPHRMRRFDWSRTTQQALYHVSDDRARTTHDSKDSDFSLVPTPGPLNIFSPVSSTLIPSGAAAKEPTAFFPKRRRVTDAERIAPQMEQTPGRDFESRD